ncbi:MAG: type II toxin-antitoxin system VapB family antitoxin [Dermatophilaceae bacterium]
MADIVIRDVANDDMARIDQRARRLGLSRNEFLRRTVQREAQVGGAAGTAADFEKFADLADAEVMRDAWS